MRRAEVKLNNILMILCVVGLNFFALTLGKMDVKLSLAGAFTTIALLLLLIGKTE